MRPITLSLFALALVGCTARTLSSPPPMKEARGEPPASTPSEYKVGGAIHGLLRPGLVLSCNGDAIAIADSPSFMCPRMMQQGDTYRIDVMEQPPGETCTVQSSSGPVTSDIHVDVDCSPLSYFVGGTVTGLEGTLVLQNNSGDDLELSKNGEFAFRSAVASGAMYEVTIAKQPDTQTCVVENAGGSIVASQIGDVHVSCTTNYYSVRVVVSGLAGKGLVIDNNDKDLMPVPVDGTYGFLVLDKSSYEIHVVTQPTDPDQTCVVTDQAGVIDGANATVNITCQ